MLTSAEPNALITVKSLKSKIIVGIFCVSTLLVVILCLLIQYDCFNRSSSEMKTDKLLVSLTPLPYSTVTMPTSSQSPEEIQRLLALKEFLNISSINSQSRISHSSIYLERFMRKIYHENVVIDDIDHFKDRDDGLTMSEQTDFLLALPNRARLTSPKILYEFHLNSSMEFLQSAILVLPIHSPSLIQLEFQDLESTISLPCRMKHRWCTINLTSNVKAFPLKFSIDGEQKRFLLSSGFLILNFQRKQLSNGISKHVHQQAITYPDDRSHCQVRPFRVSFTKLQWSSFIVEPNFYDMDLCSGTCLTGSNLGIYSIIQNYLHEKSPQTISRPCCQPKSFGSTLFLYYDGLDLMLKQVENTRVLECGCSL